MRKRVYKLPTKKWVEGKFGWYSRPRTADEVEDARRGISAMTFIHTKDIKWVPQHTHFIVFMP